MRSYWIGEEEGESNDWCLHKKKRGRFRHRDMEGHGRRLCVMGAAGGMQLLAEECQTLQGATRS